MKLTINVKPSIVTATRKEEITRKAGGISFTCGTCGNYITSSNQKDAIVINYHKVNRKIKRTINRKGEVKSSVVRESHWIGYIYRFKLELLMATKLQVKQKTRNFEIINQ